MEIYEKNLKGVFEVKPEPHADERGFFMRIYDDKIFQKYGIHRNWVQESHSFSRERGTVRGLHFQYPPDAEAKLVRAWSGEAFMVYVDLRKSSPTFGKWESTTLSGDQGNMLFLPRGFALGMCTLSDDCHLHYKIDNYYASKNAAVIKWDDPDLKIRWPVEGPFHISERDQSGKSFKEFKETHGGLEV